LTLLVLQTSFLVPPFGYAVLMLRNRLMHDMDTRRFVRALLPYLLAQIAALALVLVFPGLLWRDSATLATPASSARPLSDDEANELLRQQTEPHPAPRE